MGIFDNKKEISRRELRRILRKGSPYVPGGGFFTWKDRINLEKKFDKIFGEYISESEWKRAMRKLKMERYYAKTTKEKTSLDRTIRYLQKLAESSPKEKKEEKKLSLKKEENIKPKERRTLSPRVGVFRRNLRKL